MADTQPPQHAQPPTGARDQMLDALLVAIRRHRGCDQALGRDDHALWTEVFEHALKRKDIKALEIILCEAQGVGHSMMETLPRTAPWLVRAATHLDSQIPRPGNTKTDFEMFSLVCAHSPLPHLMILMGVILEDTGRPSHPAFGKGNHYTLSLCLFSHPDLVNFAEVTRMVTAAKTISAQVLQSATDDNAEYLRRAQANDASVDQLFQLLTEGDIERFASANQQKHDEGELRRAITGLEGSGDMTVEHSGMERFTSAMVVATEAQLSAVLAWLASLELSPRTKLCITVLVAHSIRNHFDAALTAALGAIRSRTQPSDTDTIILDTLITTGLRPARRSDEETKQDSKKRSRQ